MYFDLFVCLSCTSTAVFQLSKSYSVFISDKVGLQHCYFLDFIWPTSITYFPFKVYHKLVENTVTFKRIT